MKTFDPPARLFKVLGNPARLALLAVLRDGEECVCHMEAQLGFRQAYISQHLMVLREAGFVRDRRDGANIFYCVAEPDLFKLIDTALALSGRKWPARATPKGRKVQCACPKCQPVTEPALSGALGT